MKELKPGDYIQGNFFPELQRIVTINKFGDDSTRIKCHGVFNRLCSDVVFRPADLEKLIQQGVDYANTELQILDEIETAYTAIEFIKNHTVGEYVKNRSKMILQDIQSIRNEYK